MNITEHFTGDIGVKVQVVKFSASLPFFDGNCIRTKLSLILELVNISSSWSIGCMELAIGVLLGFGGEAGFEYDVSTWILGLVMKAGIGVGLFFSIKIDIKDMMGL